MISLTVIRRKGKQVEALRRVVGHEANNLFRAAYYQLTAWRKGAVPVENKQYEVSRSGKEVRTFWNEGDQ